MHEVLPAEARLHRHDKDNVDHRQERQDRLCRGVRFNDNTRLFAEPSGNFYSLENIFLTVGLDMEGHHIRPGLAELLGIANRPVYHKMNVNEHIRRPAQGFEHGDTDGNIRHEQTVHYIKMQIVGTRGRYLSDLPAEFRKIGGQY